MEENPNKEAAPSAKGAAPEDIDLADSILDELFGGGNAEPETPTHLAFFRMTELPAYLKPLGGGV
jgi:hypothetical protein